MKALLTVLTLMMSASAYASQMPNPILQKTVSAGFVMQEYRTSYNCRIYSDRVEITQSAGLLSSITVKPVILSGDVSKMVDEAAKGTIIQMPAPTDGPITGYTGIQTVGAGAPKEVVLKYEGSRQEKNDARVAITLINFINQLCN